MEGIQGLGGNDKINMLTNTKKQNIVIYKDLKGNVELKADVVKETIWATQAEIVRLFAVDQSVVSRHVNNIVKDKEVDGKSNMQKMHIASSDKPITLYSLDIILAVGYRTNSSKAIKFRKWATQTLREFILKGAVFNMEKIEKLHKGAVVDISKKIEFIQRTLASRQLDTLEVGSLLSVIRDYANSWTLLQKYDEGGLVAKKSRSKEKIRFDYDYIRPQIDDLKNNLIKKGEATDLFSSERDQSFRGILKTIYQTYDSKELYASLEEKAAHLLYFVIKDHPFSDGNKRTGAFLFVLFLQLNGLLYRKNINGLREKKISDNALVAVALLVATSNPKEKDNMIALITNLII